MKKNIVGESCKKIRIAKGLKQNQVATLLSKNGWIISRETYAKIENGIRYVSDEEILYLSEALNVEIPELFPPTNELKVLAQNIVKINNRSTSANLMQ